jgi:hypothetical protein
LQEGPAQYLCVARPQKVSIHQAQSRYLWVRSK